MGDRSTGITRRTVLQTSATVAGIGAFGQAVSANPGRGSGQCSCPDDLRLLAKYEYDEETDTLVFEKGYDQLGIDGSEITFSDIVTKDEDDEIIAFSWDSDPYEVTSVTVKAGQYCLTLDQSGTSGRVDLREEIDDRPIPAVSNVSFCAIVYYQVDFVEEDAPIQPPRYGGTGLISAIVGNSRDGLVDQRTFSEFTLLDTDDWMISVSSDGTTASVDFDVVRQPEEDLLLASYVIPGPLGLSGSRPEIELQRLVDYDVGTFDDGDSGSLQVALPQVD